MDLVSKFGSDPGAWVIGAMWAIYVVADRIRQDRSDRKRQATYDDSTKGLLDALNTSVNNANKLADEERKRATTLAEENSRLSGDAGKLRAELEYLTRTYTAGQADADRMRQTIEQLVLEARSKDRSIADLVALNRNLLQTIGCNIPPGT